MGLADHSWSLQPCTRVEFGVGAIERMPSVLEGLGADRALVVTDPGLRATGLVDLVGVLLGAAGVETAVYDQVTPNPTTGVVDDAAAVVRQLDGPVVIGLGGGSSLDAAKAIALLGANPGSARSYASGAAPSGPGLAVVAVPTTAGTGAETNGFGVIEDREESRKVYLGDDSVRPRASILDPGLTVGLPAAATAATGMDALVHGIESLSSRGSNPLSAAYATEAVRLVGANLVRAVQEPADVDARAAMLLGSHLAGLALSISGLGLVHGIAHAVTNQTGAVHGLALAAVLYEVMERSVAAAGDAYERVGEAMGVPTSGVVATVRDLASAVGTRRPLHELGVDPASVPAIAAGALADPVSRNHPRTMDAAEVEEIVRLAW